VFLSKADEVFSLAVSQRSAAASHCSFRLFRESPSVTHRAAVLLTFNDLKQIDDVLVEIEDLCSQLEIRITK
jgi:hypothetical protein